MFTATMFVLSAYRFAYGRMCRLIFHIQSTLNKARNPSILGLNAISRPSVYSLSFRYWSESSRAAFGNWCTNCEAGTEAAVSEGLLVFLSRPIDLHAPHGVAGESYTCWELEVGPV